RLRCCCWVWAACSFAANKSQFPENRKKAANSRVFTKSPPRTGGLFSLEDFAEEGKIYSKRER
ncbi:MAG TPA: hypothetical protein PK054_11485, partial [Anaerohalosphaeraceae bacterium]|nr:hypothetical protein [Anaerohalosphaeraceae bacterium]